MALNQFYDLNEKYIDGYHFQYLPSRSHSIYWGINIKMRALWNYVCSQGPQTSQRERDMARFIYEDAFGGRSEVSAPEFGGGFSDIASREVRIRKITNAATYRMEVSGIDSFLKAIAEDFQRMVQRNFETYTQ